MTPSTADLQAFVTVSELQSFAAAARKLHLSQPALSRRISTLEKRLGVRLFDRTTRSVELTTLGRRFLSEVSHALESLDRSVASLHDVAHLEAGDVTIGCLFSAAHHFLPGVIRSFRHQHPRVLVRIVDETAAEVLASVKSGLADFAINYTGMQDPEVEFTPLMRESFVVACPADHPLARRRTVSWAEFGAHPYALVSHESRIRVLIDHALAQVARLPRPICEVRHVSTLIALVESGLAITVVPELALPQRRGSVVAVRLGEPTIERTIGIVHRTGRSLSPAAASFAGMLTSAIETASKRKRRAS